MGKGQWQHYLPRVFLRGFGPVSGEIWRYDRAAGRSALLPIARVGAEYDLYSLVSGAELSREIETQWFSPLDGCVGPLIRKLDAAQPLTASEVGDLANFVAYLRVRTPSAIRQIETGLTQLKGLIGPVDESVIYHATPPDRPDVTFLVNSEQSDLVPAEQAKPSEMRNEVLQLVIHSGKLISRALGDLQWTVIRAPVDRSFVVGDNPLVVVPPARHDIELEGVGPMTPGAATFVPLSSRLCLRFTDPVNTRSTVRRVSGSEVRAINACQVLNSEQYIFGPSNRLLQRLTTDITDLGKNLREVVVREASAAADPSRFLLHSFYRCKVGLEWASKVPID